MKELVERIRLDGVHVGGGIVKVDSFLNHQVDPALMDRMAKERSDERRDGKECRARWAPHH